MNESIILLSFERALLLGRLLLALAFGLLLLSLAWTASKRLLPLGRLCMRLTAAYVILAWMLTLGFHLFISIGWFKPLPVAAVLLCLFAIAFRRGWLKPGIPALHIRSRFQGISATVLIFIFLPAALFFIFLLARSLNLPLLGWDAMTYHALKAGLWVQQGHLIWDYNAPGGWQYYRTFFAGGEVFTAWAMFLTGTTHLAALPDGLHAMGLGLAAFSVARLFGADKPISLALASLLLTSWAVADDIGSCYFDTGQNAMLFAGFGFMGFYNQQRKKAQLLLSFAALGLAVSIKISAVVFVAALMLMWLLWSIRRKNELRAYRRWCLILVLAFVLPVLPWIIYNLLVSGYPLGGFSFNLGSLWLGKAPPSLQWFLDRPELNPYTVKAEFYALLYALSRTALLLPLAAVALVFGRQEERAGPWLKVMAVAAALSLCLQYASPAFSVIRLADWASVNDRFLLPAIVLALVSMGKIRKTSRGYKAILVYIATGVWLHIGKYMAEFILPAPDFELRHSLITLVLIIAACLLLGAMTFHSSLIKSIWFLMLCFLPLAGVFFLRQPGTDMAAFRHSTVLHGFPRYWVHALEAFQKESGCKRLAVTAGRRRDSNCCFIYPFMGLDLQNSVHYLSPYAHGGLVPNHPDFDYVVDADFASWYQRLRQRGITHVMSFKPGSIELNWMQTHPDKFIPLACVRELWGVYRVRVYRSQSAKEPK